jgi:hypothetical protein
VTFAALPALPCKQIAKQTDAITHFALISHLSVAANLSRFSAQHVRVDYGPAHDECDRGPPTRYAEPLVELLPPANSADAGYENTIIDAPETPAHQFAVKAFKHALFGTPAPEDMHKKHQKKPSPDGFKAKAPELARPKEDAAPSSPSKQPAGIMKTPITAGKSRKSVSFGAHVVDNEGKRDNASQSGIPNNCPGKFPSPWTPGTALKAGVGNEQKPPSKLTAALLDARTTTQPKSGQKPKARDDSDITMDMGAPRSDSGKYWKDQYEGYAERSEKEMKKLVAKQQLAKNYARKKDGEVTQLTTQIEGERKRHKRREQELEQQNKDFQERLRQAMAENLSASVELTALKNRIATLEKSKGIPPSIFQESKESISIYEDAGKDRVYSPSEVDFGPEASYLSTKSRLPPAGKENSPPKARHSRRGTLPDVPARSATPFTSIPRLGVEDGHVSTVIARSPHARRASHSATKADSTSRASEQMAPPPRSSRKTELGKEDLPPKSQPKVLHSSPLPQPSLAPDMWMDNSESAIGPQDKMAIPISLGGPSSYSKPSQSLRHRNNKLRTQRSKASPPTDDIFLVDTKPEPSKPTGRTTKVCAPVEQEAEVPQNEKTVKAGISEASNTNYSPTDPKFDLSKITTHHAEGSALVTKERVEIGPAEKKAADRKDEVRRRLAERKKRKETFA